MYYKTDWHLAKERFFAFWNNDIIDRCCIAVYAPRKTSILPPFPELQNGSWLGGLDRIPDNDLESIKYWWTDPEQNYERMILWFENTYFGGEALPATYIDWGSSALAAFYGSPPVYGKQSVWYPAVIKSWSEWEWKFVLEENECWQSILRILNYFSEHNNGRYFVGSPELGPAADVLSLLRGMDLLCLDLVDNPEQIDRAVQILAQTWIEIMEKVHLMTLADNDGGGILAWLSLWAPGRHDQIACDFSSVISPKMFKRFFVPELKTLGDWCEYSTYHLDGPDAMKNHLNTLLSIEQIDNIEWTPGAGKPATFSPQYIPQYQKIQQAGKRLTLLAEPKEIEPLLNALRPQGLFIITHMESEEEADLLLSKAPKWSANKNTFAISMTQ